MAAAVGLREQITLAEVWPSEEPSLANAEVWLLEALWMVVQLEATDPKAVPMVSAVGQQRRD